MESIASTAAGTLPDLSPKEPESPLQPPIEEEEDEESELEALNRKKMEEIKARE